MNKIFEQWSENLVPVTIQDELNEKGKKQVEKFSWKTGRPLNKNSIALLTGFDSVNVIDVDTKDFTKLEEPFMSWVEDRLMYEDTLIVETQNGFHFYFYSDYKIKTTAGISPFVDVRGEGGVIFIHSDSKVANYKVYTSCEPLHGLLSLEGIIHKHEQRKLVPKKEVVGFSNLVDETDTEILQVKKETLATITEMINNTSSNVPRLEWLAIMASAYNLIDTKPERLENVLQEWSKSGDSYTDAGFLQAWSQITSGKFGGSHEGGALIVKSREGGVKVKIENSKSIEELEVIAKELSTVNIKKVEFDVHTKALASRCKELTGKPEKSKWNGLAKFIMPEENPPDDTNLYLCQGAFIIQHEKTVIENVKGTMLGKYLATFNISKAQQDALLRNLVAVENIRYVPDYTINSDVKFTLGAYHGTKLPSFEVRNNPLINIGDYIHDDEILTDFLTDIWNGKAEDIVRLIALTIKAGETKLNRLMLVAPSNTGKSEIFSMMNFQKITMKRLLNGMRADKGIGSQVIDGIRDTGLLLIDETNTALEAEIKDMDKELHIDQFGSGGTQILPLHFTALTSTHKTATRNNSDELYNRFLQVELLPSESKHTIMQSKVFLQDSEKYTNVVKSFMLSLFRQTILGDEGKAELNELQQKYRLPSNNDLDVLLFDIGEEFIANTKKSATDDGDVVVKGESYYYKRKGDITSFFEDKLGEVGSLDVGKYSELLSNHFVQATRKSVKIDGKPTKYYEVSLRSFTEDKEEIVKSMFDDLELEEL